ncbi:hypothetical protein HHK36_029139 [Tetracentron sinense]|uniref:Uncharacterized protein n=1 Tax=Tetracentron sinense TaxID=13715 RepID=A0A834YIN0_TETSI|nr:hypothetical protein HHK36_029139 [Tetracentron sinense]
MGNCMETCTHGQQEEKKQQQQQKEEQKASDFVKEDGSANSSFRVKIVLSKEELEWFMFQLQDNGGRKLEDVLGEIEKGRGKVQWWKPSLESIMETPEVHEMDR